MNDEQSLLSEEDKKRILEEEKFRRKIREVKHCFRCGEKIDKLAEICPECGVRQPLETKTSGKSRLLAAFLALFLGTFGIHKFYLNRNAQGVIYLLFFWTLLPTLLSLLDCVHYLVLSDENFERKFGEGEKGRMGL